MRKKLFLVTVGLLGASHVAQGEEVYKLIFADEFNGTGSFDTSFWEAEEGFQRNNEEQYYQAENIQQRDGNLVFTAKRETVENENYDANSGDWRRNTQYAHWTSGSMVTKGKFNFLYGRVECRAKVTNLLGTWPAIWTVGDGIEWPAGGEIDIMENYKGKILANYAVAGSGRWNARWDSHSVEVSDLGPNWEDDYHIWRMDWTPDRISIYLDDVLLNEYDPSSKNSSGSHAHPGIAPFQTFDQALWLNLAIGGNAGGDTSALPDETEYLVDYIRVYQLTELEGYSLWAHEKGLFGDEGADDDSDGLINFLEYSFGGDPLGGFEKSLSPRAKLQQDNLEMTYRRRKDDSSLSYIIEVTDDLVSGAWSNVGYVENGANSIDEQMEEAVITVGLNDEAKFVRLRVENAQP